MLVDGSGQIKMTKVCTTLQSLVKDISNSVGRKSLALGNADPEPHSSHDRSDSGGAG